MIIFNELEYAEKLLNNGFSQPYNKRFKDIFILIKYYKYIGYKHMDVKTHIIDFLIKYDSNFNITMNNEDLINIEKIIFNVYKNNYNFRYGLNVNITYDEMKRICEIKTKGEKQVLFIILILCKFYGGKSNFRVQYNDLFELTDIYYNRNFTTKIIDTLENQDTIEMLESNCIQVNILNNNSNILYNISNYSNLKTEFYKCLNSFKEYNKTHCIKCGSTIIPINNKSKYCEICAKEVIKEQWKKASYKYYHKIENTANIDGSMV